MAVTLESVEDLSADQVRTEYIVCVSDMLSHARALLASTISANRDVRVTVGLVAAVLHRMIECATSILILAGQNRSRDMAVLLLNLMELRIDLQYIALSPERESQWLEHRKEWQKPWNRGAQLKEIFPRPEERQADTNMYHMFSMIKHGSPAKEVFWLTEQMKTPEDQGGVAFSITCNGKKLIVDQQDFRHMTGTFLFATGHNVHAGAQAASQILTRHNLSFPGVGEKLTASARALGAILERDCMRKMVQWVKADDPEFDRLCKELKRLTAERDQVAERLDAWRKAAGKGEV